MAKTIPQISKYMTLTPTAINSESTLVEAMDVMTEKKIRHLPVIKSGNIFGLISDRDIRSICSYAGANPKLIKVGDVCSDVLYKTTPSAPLNEVAAEMADQKLGSALVIDNGHLVGIFTATDACLALKEICEQRFHA
jgi:acetoin utilization protein AcuB